MRFDLEVELPELEQLIATSWVLNPVLDPGNHFSASEAVVHQMNQKPRSRRAHGFV